MGWESNNRPSLTSMNPFKKNIRKSPTNRPESADWTDSAGYLRTRESDLAHSFHIESTLHCDGLLNQQYIVLGCWADSVSPNWCTAETWAALTLCKGTYRSSSERFSQFHLAVIVHRYLKVEKKKKLSLSACGGMGELKIIFLNTSAEFYENSHISIYKYE